MSTRQKNSNPFITVLVVAAFVYVAAGIIGGQVKRAKEHPPSQPQMTAAAPARIPTVNPLVRMLTPGADTPDAPGVAAAILMDVSGSMEERVRDADGSSRRKIEIARRCAGEILAIAERYAKEDPSRQPAIGIYEFSSLGGAPAARRIVPLGPPNAEAARAAIARMKAAGGTPIGDAVITAKQDLDATGRARRHILVVTDGLSNQGYDPEDVLNAIMLLPEEERASVYFIAFDVAEDRFKSLRDAGALVLPASSGAQLEQALGYVLTGKILVEQPEVPSATR